MVLHKKYFPPARVWQGSSKEAPMLYIVNLVSNFITDGPLFWRITPPHTMSLEYSNCQPNTPVTGSICSHGVRRIHVPGLMSDHCELVCVAGVRSHTERHVVCPRLFLYSSFISQVWLRHIFIQDNTGMLQNTCREKVALGLTGLKASHLCEQLKSVSFPQLFYCGKTHTV